MTSRSFTLSLSVPHQRVFPRTLEAFESGILAAVTSTPHPNVSSVSLLLGRPPPMSAVQWSSAKAGVSPRRGFPNRVHVWSHPLFQSVYLNSQIKMPAKVPCYFGVSEANWPAVPLQGLGHSRVISPSEEAAASNFTPRLMFRLPTSHQNAHKDAQNWLWNISLKKDSWSNCAITYMLHPWK